MPQPPVKAEPGNYYQLSLHLPLILVTTSCHHLSQKLLELLQTTYHLPLDLLRIFR
ncbi:hypothetical protein BVRB_018750 [Beta vulgaris subsp. vulgaris]|uniref:Uncharacterized protein n=1 Tax=Beta vulgaris subsp. vulgaris TaxID=3555 RepID=A0A0J7YLR6_BETVV|nr:hypothetical protein BVRB_018750 [Beta vulgaris subsp. vulgaris]